MNGEKAPYGEVSYDGIDLYHGECLAVMDELIQRGVKVDAIITDPPYGTTSCKWDTVIPFDAMWLRLNQLIKPNGVIILFGGEPFSSLLRVSNLKNYKYDWKWDKKAPRGFLNAKKRPLKRYEDVLVFSNGVPIYFPIKDIRGKPRNKDSYNKRKGDGDMVYGKSKNQSSFNNDYYPTDIIEISNANQQGKSHPTQKPVALMEYLIKTYTNEGELVLDFTMGSGTTCVAAYNTGRKCIGIEMDDKYFEVAKQRVSDAINTKAAQLF